MDRVQTRDPFDYPGMGLPLPLIPKRPPLTVHVRQNTGPLLLLAQAMLEEGLLQGADYRAAKGRLWDAIERGVKRWASEFWMPTLALHTVIRDKLPAELGQPEDGWFPVGEQIAARFGPKEVARWEEPRPDPEEYVCFLAGCARNRTATIDQGILYLESLRPGLGFALLHVIDRAIGYTLSGMTPRVMLDLYADLHWYGARSEQGAADALRRSFEQDIDARRPYAARLLKQSPAKISRNSLKNCSLDAIVAMAMENVPKRADIDHHYPVQATEYPGTFTSAAEAVIDAEKSLAHPGKSVDTILRTAVKLLRALTPVVWAEWNQAFRQSVDIWPPITVQWGQDAELQHLMDRWRHDLQDGVTDIGWMTLMPLTRGGDGRLDREPCVASLRDGVHRLMKLYQILEPLDHLFMYLRSSHGGRVGYFASGQAYSRERSYLWG